MDDDRKNFIIEECRSVTQGIPINWDRCTLESNTIVVYGWIPRKDSKRDFLMVMFTYEEDGWRIRTVTSSAKYSQAISKNMNSEHEPCLKIQEVFGGI